jgi:hypothetical protein
MKAAKIGAAAAERASVGPSERRMPKATHSATARSRAKPTNHVSSESLAVPVLPRTACAF